MLYCGVVYVGRLEAIVFFDLLWGYSYNSPLMSGHHDRLPLQVDPFRMAELGREFEGAIEIRQLKRLTPLLRSDTGMLGVKLDFGIDASGVKFMHGLITGELELDCQRCMGELILPLQIDFHLALLRDETQLEKLQDEYEPLLVEAVPIFIADVIEDEALLAIPQIPKHEEDECAVKLSATQDELSGTEAEMDEKANPFAVLAKLKKDH